MSELRGAKVGRGRGDLAALVAVCGLGLVASFETLALFEFGGGSVARSIAMYGDVGIELLSRVVVLLVGVRLAERLDRETWCALAASVLLTAGADALWTGGGISWQVMGVGVSLAEVLYLVSYAVFAGALSRYAFKSRENVDIVWVGIETVVMTALVGALLWVTFLAPTTRAIGGIDSAISADLSYVFFDFPLLFAPALAVLLVKIRLGDRRLARPWFAVAAGVAVLITAEVAWFWERAHGGFYPGSLAGFGFMTANILFVVGAVTALETRPRPEADAALEASRRVA